MFVLVGDKSLVEARNEVDALLESQLVLAQRRQIEEPLVSVPLVPFFWKVVEMDADLYVVFLVRFLVSYNANVPLVVLVLRLEVASPLNVPDRLEGFQLYLFHLLFKHKRVREAFRLF